MFISSSAVRCHLPTAAVLNPLSARTSASVAHCGGIWPLPFGDPAAPSVIQAIPLVVWLRPVNRRGGVGEHSGVVCLFLYRPPRGAFLSMFGVSITPP